MTDRATSPMERERTVVTSLVGLQLLLWLGFAVHRSPRFPGSLSGTLLGIAGATLMVGPSVAYLAVKRIPSLKQLVGARLPLRKLLAWHVYGGILGSILAILHTGHRFESTLGLLLTGVMLLTVFSGYVGRHFLGKVSLQLREKQALLEQLVTAYNEVAGDLAAQPQRVAAVVASASRWSRLRRRLGLNRPSSEPEAQLLAYRATEIAGSIADVEYGIKTDELLRRRFKTWFLVHIVLSIALYGFLGLHIWASLYFGLRWLD